MSRYVRRTVLLMLLSATPLWAQVQRRTDPNAERALNEYRQGWQYLRSEKFEEAVEAFKGALELNPTMTLAHYGLGRAYMALHRYTEATIEYTTCRDGFVADAGRQFTSQIEANRARQDRLMELQDLASQYSKGPQTNQTADVQRQIQNAIRNTQDAADRGMNMSIDTSVPAFLSVALGSAYFRADRIEDAEREYRAAIAADSKAGEAYNNLAVICLLTNRFDEAERHVKSAEKAGFRVNPDLKDEIKAKKAS